MKGGGLGDRDVVVRAEKVLRIVPGLEAATSPGERCRKSHASPPDSPNSMCGRCSSTHPSLFTSPPPTWCAAVAPRKKPSGNRCNIGSQATAINRSCLAAEPRWIISTDKPAERSRRPVVRARDAHRALPGRRHTVQPQDRHVVDRAVADAVPVERTEAGDAARQPSWSSSSSCGLAAPAILPGLRSWQRRLPRTASSHRELPAEGICGVLLWSGDGSPIRGCTTTMGVQVPSDTWGLKSLGTQTPGFGGCLRARPRHRARAPLDPRAANAGNIDVARMSSRSPR